MKDRKTRAEKERAEIRKLRKEKDELREMNKALTERIEEISQCSKPKNRKKVAFWYLYDIMVSALILVCVYWFAIKGNNGFDKIYICFLGLVVLIFIKCLLKKIIFQVILNDLLKPFISMLLGLFICMRLLGKEWRDAHGYAMDVVNTLIMILLVTLVVMIIFVLSYIVNRVKKVWQKNIIKLKMKKCRRS